MASQADLTKRKELRLVSKKLISVRYRYLTAEVGTRSVFRANALIESRQNGHQMAQNIKKTE